MTQREQSQLRNHLQRNQSRRPPRSLKIKNEDLDRDRTQDPLQEVGVLLSLQGILAVAAGQDRDQDLVLQVTAETRKMMGTLHEDRNVNTDEARVEAVIQARLRGAVLDLRPHHAVARGRDNLSR